MSLAPYTVLYGDTGIAVVVPEFEKKERRRAAQLVWDDHVGGDHLDSMSEFSDLMGAAKEEVWFAHPTGERPEDAEDWWSPEGNSDIDVKVYFFLLDDIPGSHSWSGEWLGVPSSDR